MLQLGSSVELTSSTAAWLLHSELHWLDVPQHIQFKLGVTVHRCLQGNAPQYLVDCCKSTTDVANRQRLRFAGRHQLIVPRHCRTKFGRRELTARRSPRSVAKRDTFRWSIIRHFLRCSSAPSALQALRNALYNFCTYLLTEELISQNLSEATELLLCGFCDTERRNCGN